MSLTILTEDQAKRIAIDAIELFIEKYLPNFSYQAPPPPPEENNLLTVKQLAEYWQCHEQTIMQKKRKGELPFVQHGRKLFFRKSEIDKLTSHKVDKRFSRNKA
jgi:excisionase family DNA binding protein